MHASAVNVAHNLWNALLKKNVMQHRNEHHNNVTRLGHEYKNTIQHKHSSGQELLVRRIGTANRAGVGTAEEQSRLRALANGMGAMRLDSGHWRNGSNALASLQVLGVCDRDGDWVRCVTAAVARREDKGGGGGNGESAAAARWARAEPYALCEHRGLSSDIIARSRKSASALGKGTSGGGYRERP